MLLREDDFYCLCKASSQKRHESDNKLVGLISYSHAEGINSYKCQIFTLSMKAKHIKSEDVEENDFWVIKCQNLLNNPEYEKFSVAIVKLTGEQKFGLDKESDLVYFVLEGEGKFFIEDKEYDVKKGDLIFIPKNTKYKDSGSLTLLAFSSPRFDRDKRVRFED